MRISDWSSYVCSSDLFHLAQVEISHFLEFSAPPSGASVINRNHDVSFLSHELVPQVTTGPVVSHCLAARSTIHIHENRVFLVGIKICRFDHPGIEHDAVFSRRDLQKFLFRSAEHTSELQ